MANKGQRAAKMDPQPNQEQPNNQTQPGQENPTPKQDPNPENNPKPTGSDPIESEIQPSSGLSRKSVHWSPDLVSESPTPNYISNVDGSTNPYVNHAPAANPNFNLKDKVATVKDVLGRWGKRVGEATKKAEDLAGNTWQHLKTGPSFVDAAMGRIAQGTKALAEGGYEKVFRQTFDTVPEEQLLNSYACYLSTSAGPVMGTLYISTAKLAYCSDNPLSYNSDGKTEWSYYKVVIPLHQLKAVNPSSSRVNPSEKYIQLISVDNHEFWLMGFLNYDGAVDTLEGALQQ